MFPAGHFQKDVSLFVCPFGKKKNAFIFYSLIILSRLCWFWMCKNAVELNQHKGKMGIMYVYI